MKINLFDAALDREGLTRHMRELASMRARGYARVINLKPVLSSMARSQSILADAFVQGEELLPASAWFLDNYPYLEEVGESARMEGRDRLPAVSKDMPRALMLMTEAVAHLDAHLDRDVLMLCAKAYMDVQALSMAELWSLPRLARIALLRAAEATAVSCVRQQEMRRDAARWVRERVMPVGVVEEIPKELMDTAAIEHIYTLLQGEEEALDSLRERLREKGLSLEGQVEAQRSKQALQLLRMSGTVQSLHRLAEMDFAPVFEELCPVERILRTEPTGIYVKQEFETREKLRAAVARIAKAHQRGETHVAREAVNLATLGSDAASRQVGYYLTKEPGMRKLSRVLGRASGAFHLFLFLERHAKGLYLGALLLFVLLSCAALWYLGGPLLSLLSIFPAFSFAQRMAGAAASRLYRPRLFCKLDFQKGVPLSSKTGIVMPVLLSQKDRVAPCVRNLERCYLANPQEGLVYILLGDFKDHDSPKKEDDDAIIQAAMEEMHRLNIRYGERFYYLHRPRKYSLSQENYMGWERKRGALKQLNQAILSGDEEAFLATNLPVEQLRDVKYLITLDADTILPPGSAARMAGAAAHPLNRAHGLLSPKAQNLYFWGQTWFSRLMSGKGGVDSYVTASSETYQDICGEGIFGGKGIYNVKAFESATAQLPQNAILSHDLLEGLLSGAGQLSDITVYESQPQTLRAWAARQHRWVRGDWQLLPFLFQTGINGLGRYKIIDNMRRSLSPLFAVLAAIFCGPLGLITLYLEMGLPRGLNWLLRFMLLPWQAFLQLDAAMRTLWRVFVSRKGLLSWVTAADVGDKGEMKPIRLWACPLAAALSLSPVLIPFWGLAPLLPFIISRQAFKRPEVKERDREFLQDMAKRTYHWFEQVLTKEDNYLPPDNVQEIHGEKIAHRTSPTNIGLALCAHVAAHDLGFIDAPELAARMEKSLSTIERLQKWNGQLYNWYDTQTLEPLPPKYISSVDNGNLGICLWAAAAAMRAVQEMGIGFRLEKLAREMDLSALYDEGRNLFYIGFDETSGRMSSGHYDLLASESRMLSFFAILKGDAPLKHFKALGRPRTQVGSKSTLLSWSGTLFEYLMPCLFLESAPKSLLRISEEGAVHAQMLAARKEDKAIRPWGESESGFNSFDLSLNYQYKAFGLPALSMRGGVQSDVVVSPYSSALALLVQPQEATQNLRAMAELGWLDEHGFYEAADYSADRRGDQEYTLVFSHMAHHQGMALLALEGALEGRLRSRFMALPAVDAYSILLHESAGRDVAPRRQRPARERGEQIFKLRYAAYTASMNNKNMHILSGAGTSVIVGNDGSIMAYKDGKCLWRKGDKGMGLYFYVDGHRLCFTKAHMDVDKVRLTGDLNDIRCRVEVAVSPEDGSIILDSHLNFPGSREETSFGFYLEPILTLESADRSHRTFSDLFLQAQAVGDDGILYTRKPRGGEAPCSMLIQLGGDGESCGMQSRRMEFIGRHNETDAPDFALKQPGDLTATPIEPCAAIVRKSSVEEGKTLRFIGRVDFQEGVPGAPVSLAMAAERCYEMAGIRSQAEIAAYNLSTAFMKTADRALALLLEPELANGVRAEHAKLSTLPQAGLWRFGVSGDYPIMLVFVQGQNGMNLAKQVAQIHTYLGIKGVRSDLVFIDEGAADYLQSVKSALQAACQSAVVIGSGQISNEERALLIARAGIVLRAPGPKIDAQLQRIPLRARLPEKRFFHEPFAPIPLENVELCDRCGYGGFTQGGEEYVITDTPPVPWSNVLSNKRFGTLVTDRLGGYTWHKNARMERLTPFSNDPVLDPQGEGVWLRDEDSGQVERFTQRVTMGQGYVVGESGALGLYARLTINVDTEKPLKLMQVHITNQGPQMRHLTLWGFAKWVLGDDAHSSARSIVTKRDGNLLFARNGYGFDWISFLALKGGEVLDYSCNAREIDAMETLLKLSGAEGSAMAPGAILRTALELGAGESANLCFVLGAADDENDARAYVDGLDPRQSLDDSKAFWDEFLGEIKVQTPSERLNRLCNRWLPYQSLSARFWGRTGFYQSGGAIGFRDQLQDAVMLGFYDQSLLKEQILLCAAHQFQEGDVQHWWHPPMKGVRTRISDDLLFLPWAACQYIGMSGDGGILDEQVPFLRGPELLPGQEDLYFEPETGESAPLYEHLIRAIRRAAKTGSHGLALMGGGDWNDAMNRVGLEGHGESVFVSFQLCLCIRDFMPYARQGDRPWLQGIYDGMKAALEEHAFDGQWYIRAYFDDGSKMGGRESLACSIDLTSQALAVLSGAVSREKASGALNAAIEQLYVPAHRMIKLLDPPFDGQGTQNPGYIAGYVPGVRENGGQYTHAAAWAVLALCKLQDPRAADLLLALLPTGRNQERYLVEPYVAVADIYAGDMIGRGGWTWYTGSAGWLWRAAVEGVCGYSFKKDAQGLNPCPEKSWEEIEVSVHGKQFVWKRQKDKSPNSLEESIS